MIRKLCVASVLALALVAATSPARAQDASFVENAAVAQAHAQYDASEAGYTRAQSGGFTGQVQSLATAGSSNQTDARSGVESAIASYLDALKTQFDAAQTTGQNDQAQAILSRVQGLRSRLQGLATDEVNQKLAARGFGSVPASTAPANATASGSTGTTTPSQSVAPETTTPAAAPAVSSASSTPSGPASLDPGPVSAKTQEKPAGKPRKATGRLVLVARGLSLEATLEQLDRICERLRAQKPLADDVRGEADVYLIERWREKTPSRIRIEKDDAHASELRRLRLSAGATCSISGLSEVATPATRAEGEVLVLRDWKLLALSTNDRLGEVAPRAPAPAPVARSKSAEKPVVPGPLGGEEENFND